MLAEKRCTHCGSVKPMDEFTKNGQTRDGRGSWCKICTREAARKNREDRPEHCREMVREWRRLHPQYMLSYQKARYAANRDQLAAEERVRRARRKAKGVKVWHSAQSLARKREAMRVYAQRHAEQIREYHRAYYAAWPGRVRGWQHARKARIRGNGGVFTNAEWIALCARFGQRCLACGKVRPLTVDHVIPLSRGGNNGIGNIQPLCKPCNSHKRQRIIDYRFKVSEPC